MPISFDDVARPFARIFDRIKSNAEPDLSSPHAGAMVARFSFSGMADDLSGLMNAIRLRRSDVAFSDAKSRSFTDRLEAAFHCYQIEIEAPDGKRLLRLPFASREALKEPYQSVLAMADKSGYTAAVEFKHETLQVFEPLRMMVSAVSNRGALIGQSSPSTPLTIPETKVLRCLLLANSRMLLVDLASDLEVSRVVRTIGPVVKSLIEKGLADRAAGKRMGVAATQQAREIFGQIAR